MPFSRFLNNCGFPEDGLYGRFVASMMNIGHGKLHKWILRDAGIEAGMKVLDVGCGGGGMARRILSSFDEAEVTAVDISKGSIETAERKCSKFNGRFTPVLSSVEALPIPDSSFDIALSSESIYFWNNPIKGLKVIRRVLKDGAHLVIVLEVTDPKVGAIWSKRVPGLRIYSRKELFEIFQKAGFINISIKEKRHLTMITGRKGPL